MYKSIAEMGGIHVKRSRSRQLIDLLFYLGMGLNCLFMTLYITIYDIPFSTVFAVAIFGLYLSVILLTRRTFKESAILFVLLLLGTCCSIVTHDTLIFRIIFMIFAVRTVDKKRFVRFIKKCYWLMIIIVPLTCVFRGVETVYSNANYGVGRESGIRFMLGFDGPNRLGIIWICLMSMILIERGKRNLKKDSILLAVMVVLYYLTKSRSLIIAGCFILLFPYFIFVIGRLKKYILNKKFILLILFCLLGITVYFAKNAADRDSIYNVLLNNRLVHFQDVVGKEQITLFGSTSNFSKYRGLDNSYFLSFYKRGIVFFGLYIISLVRIAIVLGRKRDIIQIAVLCGYIILAFVQDMIVHPYINVVYFIIMINYVDFFGIKSYSAGVKEIR